MVRTNYQTTSKTGLRQNSPAMRLWHKAKKLGTWDPRDIDFAKDHEHWQTLNTGEKDLLLRLISLFQAGEESVTLDLLPLILTIANEGRLEEEMYLTSFLWEEAKHVEVFRRFLDEVAGVQEDLSHYHTESYRQIFYESLPGAMSRLLSEPSPVAQAEASVTYNMIVEGVLAETGYFGFYNTLERNHILPGLLQVTGKLKQDESRHIAYGVYLLSRLVAEHGQPVWLAIESRMNALLEPALGMINEIFAAYPEIPFGLDLDEFLNFALNQFQKRMDRIELAKSQTLQEVETIALEAL